jgi:hypothetical protein
MGVDQSDGRWRFALFGELMSHLERYQSTVRMPDQVDWRLRD